MKKLFAARGQRVHWLAALSFPEKAQAVAHDDT